MYANACTCFAYCVLHLAIITTGLSVRLASVFDWRVTDSFVARLTLLVFTWIVTIIILVSIRLCWRFWSPNPSWNVVFARLKTRDVYRICASVDWERVNESAMSLTQAIRDMANCNISYLKVVIYVRETRRSHSDETIRIVPYVCRKIGRKIVRVSWMSESLVRGTRTSDPESTTNKINALSWTSTFIKMAYTDFAKLSRHIRALPRTFRYWMVQTHVIYRKSCLYHI